MAVGSAPAVVVSSTLPQMDTGQEMILSSSMTLTTRKTKYSMNMMDPSSLLMRHLQAAMEMMTNSSMRKRRTMAQKSPLELTCTGLISLIKDQRSQGNGRLPQTKSKLHTQLQSVHKWAKLKTHYGILTLIVVFR